MDRRAERDRTSGASEQGRRRSTPRIGGLRLVASLALLALLSFAGATARAGADPEDDAGPARVEGAHPRSATPPTALGPAAEDDAAPATRASVRERIDGIDPVHWLARFGEVERQSAPPAE